MQGDLLWAEIKNLISNVNNMAMHKIEYKNGEYNLLRNGRLIWRGEEAHLLEIEFYKTITKTREKPYLKISPEAEEALKDKIKINGVDTVVQNRTQGLHNLVDYLKK